MQWTLFRSAMAPGADDPGWGNGQVWMAHAAATGAATHRFAETFARGGVGQAGVAAAPFRAWHRRLEHDGDRRRRATRWPGCGSPPAATASATT